MQEIIPDVALIPALQKLVDQDITYRLFTNDITPDASTVLADLTEAPNPGVFPVVVSGVEWIPNDPVNGVGLLIHPPIALVNGTGGDLSAYGYFRTDQAGELMAVCRFDGAPVLKHDGEAWTIIPIVGDTFEEL